ncbi:MAG: hypothetical protein Q9219_002645 [cf. Caloplaca sp. 3 TL-2023]
MSQPTTTAAASADEAVDMLARINQDLRKAVLASFPCAFEQYVAIQMPGAIIDTRLGGSSYLLKGEKATADIRNMIQCNEAMLVDSMVPLDKIMLGPTGKSVTRSYMTALDMLVPRKTDIGSVDVDSDLTSDSSSKYSQAMKFLRSKETLLTPKSEIVGTRLRNAKDKMEGSGVSGTVVDRYVEKQIAWSEARGKWDTIRSEALEARESREDLQSAALSSARQKDLKRAQGELHARWMDWVVNGDKFRVEYCFSVVDRDLSWRELKEEEAQICRAKAIDWKTRNPVNPAQLQLRLESLKRMRQAYQVYDGQLENRRSLQQPKADWQTVKDDFEKAKKDYDAAELKKDTDEEAFNKQSKIYKSQKPLYDAMEKAERARIEKEDAEKASTAAQAGTETAKETARITLKQAREQHEKLQVAAAHVEEVGVDYGEQEAELEEALRSIYHAEAAMKGAKNDKEKEEGLQTHAEEQPGDDDSALYRQLHPGELRTLGPEDRCCAQDRQQGLGPEDGRQGWQLVYCVPGSADYWMVSEILPQMPRGSGMGGLTAPPNTAFRV